MHDQSGRILARTRRLLDERVRPSAEVAHLPLDISARDLPGEPEPFGDVVTKEFLPFSAPGPWGPQWGTTWFHCRGEVPREWLADHATETAAVIDLGFEPDSGPGFQCEGLVYDPAGRIMQGLHPMNQRIPLTQPVVDLYVEAAANPDVASHSFRPTHLGDGPDPTAARLYRLERADIVRRDPRVDALAIDLEVLLGWAELWPSDRPRRAKVLAALDRACDVMDALGVREGVDGARGELVPVLSSPAESTSHHIVAMGHAHIDTAWLWPTRETIRKCARSFSNVLALSERYPELRFACSQAQQYEWIEQTYPELFARISVAVQKGTWVPAGGMWVEPDTNMTGGEAMVRQFLYGKKYFQEHFGVEPHEVWLPDSFGYSGALPQIAELAGFRWFLTQKLAWQKTDRFPHHTFWWQGIDGTRLFVHMPPADTYLSGLTPAELNHAVTNFSEHPGASLSAIPFGHGDGGGGPTAVMMERARRQADLEGSPTIEHATPEEFFSRAEAEYPDAPTWVGELYFEAHRGTFTSQAETKKGNRHSEHLLREAELWCATATVRTGAEYPYDVLERLWKKLLVCQFHDILPGSSIQWVYRQAEAEYRDLEAESETLIARALECLGGGASTRDMAFNAGPLPVAGVPALGAAPARATDAAPVEVSRSRDSIRLDNGLLRLTLDAGGCIASLVDVSADRELVPAGARLNRLVLHPDHPNEFDAWDVDVHYLHSARSLDDADELSVDRLSDGSVTITVNRHFGDSSAVQRTTVRPGAREVEFRTDVDWHEHEHFLKVAFPLDLLAEESSSEIQFGHIRRPTHANTTWDAEKFEICAHRWVHVGEPGFGVAIANDRIYGHDIRQIRTADMACPSTQVRLSLLRGPRFPDPEADQGRHTFNYALVSGADIIDAIAAGYRLNVPMRRVAAGKEVPPLIAVESVEADRSGVLVESLKLADDRSGDVIVRLYESLGRREQAVMHLNLPSREVRVVDLLERATGAPLAVTDDAIRLEMRPFQILTVRISTGAPTSDRQEGE